MSCRTHYTLNFYESVCSGKFYDNMTQDAARVTCDQCGRFASRITQDSTPPKDLPRTESGRPSRMARRAHDQRMEAKL